MTPSKMLKVLAQPKPDGEKAVDTVARIARLAGFEYSRCYEIYYNRARRIEPAETARISEALDIKTRRETRNELHKLKTRLARLESLLVQADAEFHREALDITRQQMRGFGGQGSSMGSGLVLKGQ